MKMDKVMKGHVPKFWGHALCRNKSPFGQTLCRKGLVKCIEIIQDHKHTRFDDLKPFSVSYCTIWDDSYGKFKGIAIRSQ